MNTDQLWRHNPRVEAMVEDASEHAERDVDWLCLALAALEQAGISTEAHRHIEALAWQAMPTPQADIELRNGRIRTR